MNVIKKQSQKRMGYISLMLAIFMIISLFCGITANAEGDENITTYTQEDGYVFIMTDGTVLHNYEETSDPDTQHSIIDSDIICGFSEEVSMESFTVDKQKKTVTFKNLVCGPIEEPGSENSEAKDYQMIYVQEGWTFIFDGDCTTSILIEEGKCTIDLTKGSSLTCPYFITSSEDNVTFGKYVKSKKDNTSEAMSFYYERPQYKVTFISQQAGVNSCELVYADSTVSMIRPTIVGFELEGWYTDIELKNKYDFSTPVTSDLTLYAKVIQKEKKTFKIVDKSKTNAMSAVVVGEPNDIVKAVIGDAKVSEYEDAGKEVSVSLQAKQMEDVPANEKDAWDTVITEIEKKRTEAVAGVYDIGVTVTVDEEESPVHITAEPVQVKLKIPEEIQEKVEAYVRGTVEEARVEGLKKLLDKDKEEEAKEAAAKKAYEESLILYGIKDGKVDKNAVKYDPETGFAKVKLNHFSTYVLVYKTIDENQNKTSYSNEWIEGKWYNADGKQDYEPVGLWKSDGTGWWFEDSSGWYPVNQWQKIDGKWYYFSDTGYMAADEWREGYWLSSSGALEYEGIGSWKSDGTGWWFEDTSGWYPVSQWQKIDGKWYYFDADGYMLYNQYVDGYWLGEDGACQ